MQAIRKITLVPPELEIAADGFGVAGVEVGDEEEGDAEDDEGDEAVGAFLAPDVEDDDFGDADEEEAEAGETEAAFTDDQREEEASDGFKTPADGDAASETSLKMRKVTRIMGRKK
jgi:hypothetical protein